MTDETQDPKFKPKLHAPAKWHKPEPPSTRSQQGFSRRPEPERTHGPRHGFRYRVDLEYLGTRYSGWQFQTNARTVAGEIMEAIHRATGQRVIEVYGSGRTDAGVHAIHQVAHIDLAKQADPDELMRSVNDELPGDINLLKVELAPTGFHARHSATARTYLYRISRRRSAFDKPVVWWVKDPLDVVLMAEAARSLCGLHDFAPFAQADPSKPDESTKVKVEAVDVYEDGPSVFIRIQGSHFLWKMVRRIVGVLVEIGRGKLSVGDVAKIMSSSAVSVAEFTAPPSGLSLEKVTYGAPTAIRTTLREEPRHEDVRPKATFRRGPIEGTYRKKPGFRPAAARSEGEGDRRGAGWPRQSTSPGSPPGSGKRTFRPRG